MYAEIFVSGVLDQVGIDERLLHMARAAHRMCYCALSNLISGTPDSFALVQWACMKSCYFASAVVNKQRLFRLFIVWRQAT